VLVILNFDLTERDAEMDTPLRRDHETPLRKHDETSLRKHDETPLRGVRPNIVQSIRAFRVQDLQDAATQLNQHFLYANLGNAQSKQDLLDMIAAQYTFPAHFGKNFDALYDCMTDLVHKSGPQPGFIVVLEQIPAHAKFDKEAREQLLDIFRDAADYWADRKIPFRCFYSFL
jgi:RNAse (barnase) inhibitor barstar